MGHQFNFIMDEIDGSDFIEFILRDGMIYKPSGTICDCSASEIEHGDSLVHDASDLNLNDLGILILYKKNLPDLQFCQNKKEKTDHVLVVVDNKDGETEYKKVAVEYGPIINTTESHVIEYSRTKILMSQKAIICGALYVSEYYYNSDDELIHKDASLLNWYEELTCWIKKKLIYLPIYNCEEVVCDYVSQSLLDELKNNQYAVYIA